VFRPSRRRMKGNWPPPPIIAIGQILIKSIARSDRLDDLTLDQMRVLIAVTEAESFSAAARRLGRVQSAVSQSVQALEQTMRLSLFDRSGKMPVLTDVGREVLHDARQVVQRADAQHAETIAGGTEPERAFAARYWAGHRPPRADRYALALQPIAARATRVRTTR
jgi:DNA-binding transcriptional LysR family regulator